VNWIRTNQRSAWIIGLTLLLPVILYGNVLFSLLSMRQGYQADIDRLAPRVARLQGLIEYQAQLVESAARADRLMVELTYPLTEDRAAAAARLQQDVRQMLVEAGLNIKNSQVLPVREVEKFDYIGLKLTVSGNVDALDAGLAAISSHSPLLLVESIEIWPNRVRRTNKDEVAEQTVSATMQLLSLRSVQ
jgi:general secretion pathway protein M